MEINSEFENKLNQAEKGRREWIKLMEEYDGEKNKYMILFLHEDSVCNKYILKYLPQFAKKVHADTLLILSSDKTVLEKIKDCAGVNCIGVYWSNAQARDLLSYYSLHMFTDKLIIASLDEPQGRNGRNMIGIKGVTEEEIVAIGILGLKSLT